MIDDTQARVVWIYLRLPIAPIGLNLDQDVPFSTGRRARRGGCWANLLLDDAARHRCSRPVGGWLVWAAKKRRSAAALWAPRYFVLLAPRSSILAQGDAMFEHRDYLPMVCTTVAAGFPLQRVPRAKLAAVFAILIPAMVAGTIARHAVWHDEKTLWFWMDIAAQSPGKGRSWLGLFKAYAEDPATAREYLNRVLAVDPDEPTSEWTIIRQRSIASNGRCNSTPAASARGAT